MIFPGIKSFTPEKDLEKQFKVRDQTPERILKGSGFVLFKESMSYPGKAVTHHWQKHPFPAPAIEDGKKQQHENQKCPYEMKDAAGLVLMFGKIKTVKFAIGFNSLCHPE